MNDEGYACDPSILSHAQYSVRKEVPRKSDDDVPVEEVISRIR